MTDPRQNEPTDQNVPAPEAGELPDVDVSLDPAAPLDAPVAPRAVPRAPSRPPPRAAAPLSGRLGVPPRTAPNLVARLNRPPSVPPPKLEAPPAVPPPADFDDALSLEGIDIEPFATRDPAPSRPASKPSAPAIDTAGLFASMPPVAHHGAPSVAPSVTLDDGASLDMLGDGFNDVLDALSQPPPAPPPAQPAAPALAEPEVSVESADVPASVTEPEAPPAPVESVVMEPAVDEPAVEISVDAAAPDAEIVVEAAVEPAPAPVVAATPDAAGDLDALDLSLDPDDFASVPAPAAPAASAVTVTSDDDDEVVFASDDSDAEFEIAEVGEEAEIEIDAPAAAPDRGAMLAATVTSRKRTVEDTDALYLVDARTEARQRAELLEETAREESYADAAEWLAVAADLLDGVVGDRARARTLAERAHALTPESLSACRVLRRFDLADGRTEDALARSEDESRGVLSDPERLELSWLESELAAMQAPDRAVARWEEIAARPGVTGALAALFAGGVRRDNAVTDRALGAWSAVATGTLAASLDVARARRVEGQQQEKALRVIREAVQRDPSDAGAWMTLARIGLARANAGVFREALDGLVRAGSGIDGRAAVAAESLRRALDAIVGESVTEGPVGDAGVAGWLVAHAQRDVGQDPAAQVETGESLSTEAQRPGWRSWRGEPSSDTDDAAKYQAVRLAAARHDDDAVATASAALLGGPDAGLLRAALRAHAGDVATAEAEAAGRATGARVILRAALEASTSGVDEAEALAAESGQSAFHAVARMEALARAGRSDTARTGLAGLADADGPAGARTYAQRAAVTFDDDLAGLVRALRAELDRAVDPVRVSGQRLLAAALSASAGLAEGTDDVSAAVRGLAGDFGAAEMGALYAIRGLAPTEFGAEVLEAVAAAGDRTPHQMASVRAALRRAALDPDVAAEAIWQAWSRCPNDASLGTLVLRTPGQAVERAVAVLRAQADAAHAAGQGGGEAATAVGSLLALALEQAGRFQDAAQAVSRARTASLHDVSLRAAEERLWARAGMFDEVSERAFDALQSADNDVAKVVTYERLAELDRVERGDLARAVLSYQAILELQPSHAGALRTLERFFTEQGRDEELLRVLSRLVDHLADAEEALAHALLASRVASLLGDGDETAGVPYVERALQRGLADRRALMTLDADFRRTGDLIRFCDVQLRAAQIAAGNQERATHLCRAAEACEALGDFATARRHFDAAHASDLGNVVALGGLARTAEQLREARPAAEAWEALGQQLQVPEQSAEILLRAGRIWREDVGDTGRALSALRLVLARNPRQPEAFALALELLRADQDARGELELITRFTEAGTDEMPARDASGLYARAAELAEQIGEPARARVLWRAVVTLEPERVEALRALGRLANEAEDWPAAADAMIRLAKVSQDAHERVELLFGLGDIFDRRIPDPRRAEAAWKRVLQALPDDVRTLERLSDLYARTGEAARQGEMLEALIQRTPTGGPKIARTLQLARVVQEGLGDPTRATALLDGVQKDVRAAIDRSVRDGPAFSRAAEWYLLRGRPDAARVIAAVAGVLGIADDSLRALSPDGLVRGVGIGALTAGALDRVSPPAIPSALRDALSRSAAVIDPLIPFDPAPLRAELLGTRAHPLRAEIERWCGLLGIHGLEIYEAPTLPSLVVPLSKVPPRVVVSATAQDNPVGRFAVARAMSLLSLGLSLPLRVSAGEFAVVLAALLRQFEPMYKLTAADPAQVDEMSRRMTKLLSRELHTEIASSAYASLKRNLDPAAIHAAVLEFGDRIALTATGDLRGAVTALLPEGSEIVRGIEQVPLVGRLVRVALSDRFFDARQVAGADAR